MTMNGQQHSLRPRSGKHLPNLAILILIICLAFLGCADQVASVLPGPGKTDWEIQLFDQYYIVRANSSSKKICKTTDTPGLYENVLSYFYVTKYYVSEPYICLEGIPTEELFASKNEQSSNIRQYYLLNADDGNLYGPYDTEEALVESSSIKGVDLSIVWEIMPK